MRSLSPLSNMASAAQRSIAEALADKMKRMNNIFTNKPFQNLETGRFVSKYRQLICHRRQWSHIELGWFVVVVPLGALYLSLSSCAILECFCKVGSVLVAKFLRSASDKLWDAVSNSLTV